MLPIPLFPTITVPRGFTLAHDSQEFSKNTQHAARNSLQPKVTSFIEKK